MSQALDQLCEKCGVLPQYHDIWGNVHHATDAVKRALLAAMGMAAGNEEEIAASLHAIEGRAWQRLLPPVQVARVHVRPHRIAIALPVEEDGRIFRWRLRRESGAEEAGDFSPGSLEEAGRAHLDGRDFVRRVLVLDSEVEPGYHRLSVERRDGGESCDMSFIVAPAECYVPPAIQGEGRVWGVAVQLYGIRSERNWGIGDFGDLRRLIEFCAESGAGAALLNPLHALFPDHPEQASPYSPSSRAYFNVLYLNVEGIADFAECAAAKSTLHSPAFQARLRALRASIQVDYRAVAESKLEVLDRLYAHFRSNHLARGSDRARAFRAFQALHGERLREHALFEALQEYFRAQDANVWGWPAWPAAYQNPRAPQVAEYCKANLARVEFYEYLQWQASLQLASAGTRSWELGLGVGLMFDLAIGVAEGGSATWSRRELHAFAASAGAPPDEINRLGQDWGLPPWIPHQLTAAAYEPFIELLRANMRDAGALRMDHVMGLCRLFWVVRGLPPVEGAYVRYPFDDLLGILALESQRNRCMVVGEDLGTVPDEVRAATRQMGVLSTRLLYFERESDGSLKPPQAYPTNAVAAVTTHDLPTLAGFWRGLDIDLRNQLHLFPDDDVRNHQIVIRSGDRAQLLVALERAGVLPEGSGMQPVAFSEMTPELAAAVYAYLARAPSKLLLMPMEDGLGVHEQPNLPGTTEPAYPCWRLKLPLNLEEWKNSPWLTGTLQVLRQERPVKEVAGHAGGAVGEGLRSWIPRATYRLQLNRDFPLCRATRLIPYLDALGVSHCYLSPLLKARPGSAHGYDITDHSSLNPEIASAEDFDQFAAALRRRGMGQIMDVVPNHMGVMGADNGWWLDVLENGPASRFAGYFDIDWYPLTEDLPGRVLLPVLGDHYGTVLENRELKLAFDAEDGAFSIFYYTHRFPVDPREYPRILEHGLDRLQARLGADHPVLLEFQSLVTSFGHLPGRDDVLPESVSERARDKEVHKHHLASLCVGSADIAQYLGEMVAEFNAEPEGNNFDLLHALLQAQAYRLAFWRVAADEINYRRFFDINDLAALRMDNPEVFETTHRLVRELLARGYVNGLRIDHPDGLYAPEAYFKRLQAMAASLRPASDSSLAETDPRALYLVVEKILAGHEYLPEAWPVHGTTGYDFAASSSGLFVNAAAEERLTRNYLGFSRIRSDYGELVRANKHLIMSTSLAGELQVLATQLTRIAKGDRHTGDYSFNSLRSALAEIIASFPVYRTYVADCEASAEDLRYVDWAVGVAKKHSQAADGSIFDFVREVLLGRHDPGRGDEHRRAVCAFAMKFQQYCSPVMAKAVEDTSFYQYNRLVSLNEVGSDPQRFGVSLMAFHRENQERARRWPHALLATSTHDSKRSEDMRARISVLSEMPDAWHKKLAYWSRLNRSKCRKLESGRAPSANDEYLLYQTLLGVWPIEAQGAAAMESLRTRVEAYMLKAGREAKVRSSWVKPNAEYEDAVRNFVQALLAPESGNLFLRDFAQFQERIARAGMLNSLSQILLKLTSPGVPDIYQGSELWDFSLVDPDNRRPVDYETRIELLGAIKRMHAELGAEKCAQNLLDSLHDGRIKLYFIWKMLALRRDHEALFRDGDYLPLKVQGERAEHVCAFVRSFEGGTVMVVVPRLLHTLAEETGSLAGYPAWGDTRIELPVETFLGRWTYALTDTAMDLERQDLPVAEVLGRFPYAVLCLHREGAPEKQQAPEPVGPRGLETM